MSEYLTIQDVADRMGVEYKTVYRLVTSGKLPSFRVGRVYRIRPQDLDAYIESQLGGRPTAAAESLPSLRLIWPAAPVSTKIATR